MDLTLTYATYTHGSVLPVILRNDPVRDGHVLESLLTDRLLTLRFELTIMSNL